MLALATALFVTGCGAEPQDGGDIVKGIEPGLTLEGAKRAAQEMERELVAMIPEENIVSVEQNETGVLLSCNDGRGYQWAGGTTVMTQGDVDIAGIVDAVVAEFSGRESFTAKVSRKHNGEPRAHISGDYGAGYLMGERTDIDAIRVLSFSRCFLRTDDVSPHGEY
ncbi:hypothetical protein [Microbacterium arborescens]